MAILFKTANESRKFNWDYSLSDEIVGGQTLTGTPTITSTPSGLTVGSALISGSLVQAQISGGSAGVKYRLSCLVNTTGGATLEDIGELNVT